MTRTLTGPVSVVVVTHRSIATIGRCLDGILASDTPIDVVVVDNASDDGTGGWVARRSTIEPRLHFIGNADNRGFATACNQGVRMATGDTLLFLNPDAFLGASTIGRLKQHLEADPGLGLIGCRVVDEAGRTHGPQRRREPTWRRSLMSLSGLSRFERRWPALAGIERPASEGAALATPLEDVDAVNGAVMMLPRAVFEQVGGFDEGFLLHAEDLDLCRRVRDAGKRVVIANDVVVAHVGGASGRRRPFWVEWQKTRSLWRYFRKHQPGTGLALRLAVGAGLALRFLVKLPVLALKRLRA